MWVRRIYDALNKQLGSECPSLFKYITIILKVCSGTQPFHRSKQTKNSCDVKHYLVLDILQLKCLTEKA